MSDSESRSAAVLELAEEFLDRYRRGERPSLAEYADRHPHLAAEIRDVFPAMAMMEKIAVTDDGGAGAAPAAGDGELPFAQLGDFRLIREVGRGGMGVVYEAEQVSLGRHVALKVLPRQLRDAKQRTRFEREAKAAAKLHHTNIVPVFGVGEQDGQPYYVMQFIQGLGLDAVMDELNRMQPGPVHTPTGLPAGGEIRVSRREGAAADVARSLLTGAFQRAPEDGEAPGDPVSPPAFAPTLDQPPAGPVPEGPSSATRGTTRLADSFTVSSSSITLPNRSKTGSKAPARKQTYWQSVAHIGRQVADAMDYAHKQGVLHRDIKPSNLLLDLRGTVWVTDFGLAKVAGPGADDLTHTGDVLGTLRYMPPEAFEGQSDARGDVYSLGLTLYELLALRPAFAERDRNKLIKQVTTGEPPPLDKVRREVPRDLVTIVQKAIAREPSRRYATAEDFGSDLQRFLDDEPVQARRQTQLERYVRWARHHPGIATLGAALTAVLVLATVASLVVAGRMSNLARNEAQAAAEERKARGEAVAAQEREARQRADAEQAKTAAVESRQQMEEALAKARKAEAEARAEGERADDQAEVADRQLFHAQMHLAQQAWREHRGLGQMRDLLNRWLPKDGSPDRRGWEWFYLHSLPYQNVRTLTESGRHGRPSAVAWHIPSNRLAEGTAEGVIRVWDVERERTTVTLTGPAATKAFWGVRWLAWSPDGSALAAGFPDATVHLWEIPSGRELHVLRDLKSPVMAVAYSSDGRRLAAWGQNGRIRVWDAETGRLTDQVSHPGLVTAGAWSPDGKFVATGHTNGTVTVSGLQAGDKKATLKGHVDSIYHLVWSPDGTRLVSTCGDFTARIWDVASEKTVVGPMRHSHGVASAAWEPDGQRLATGSFDEALKVWDTATGREVLTLRGHVQTVISLAWGPGGRLASGCNDGSMKVWTAVRDQEASPLPGHGVRATAVAWSPDGKRLASGGDDGKIRIWDAATREEVLSIKAHDERKIFPQFGLIRSLAWSPDGTRLASGGLDGAAKVWDAATGREVFALPADGGHVWSVAWSPDGTQLAAGAEDGTVRVVEGVNDSPKVRKFKAHQRRARGLAWRKQGDRLASVGADGFVKVWDAVRGGEVARMHGVPGWIMGVSWSPDGTRLATSHGDRVVFVWDPETKEKLATMRGHNDFVDAVVWSPDRTRLASAGLDNSVRIWDPRTGEETFVLRGATGMFHDVAWHPDGARLAAASSDGQIWIWDATPGFERDTTARALPYIERKFATNPPNNAERLRVAKLAYDHKRFAVAARLWAEALAEDPNLAEDPEAQHRHTAARAACLAAAGRGQDEPPPDDGAKAKLRAQALDWLKAELTALGKRLESAFPEDRGALVMAIGAWRHDRDLSDIRDPAALAGLPAGEQKAFTQFWADVTAVIKAGNAKHGAFLQDRLAEARPKLPEDSPDLAYLLAQIGQTLLEQERWTEAEGVLRECLAIREKAVPDAWLTFNAISALGGSLLGQKRYAEAEPLLLKGYTGMKDREATIPPVGKDRLPEAVDRLIDLYTATNRADEVTKWRAEQAKAAAGPPRLEEK